MKKFSFSLDKVHNWRRTQQRVAEAQLERIHADLRSLALSRARLDADERDAGRALLLAPVLDAGELAAWEDYRRWVGAEHRRLDVRESKYLEEAKIATEKLMERRREVKLLDRMEEKKRNLWQSAVQSELDAEAGEMYLASAWHRL
jgi:hypothetical protein